MRPLLFKITGGVIIAAALVWLNAVGMLSGVKNDTTRAVAFVARPISAAFSFASSNLSYLAQKNSLAQKNADLKHSILQLDSQLSALNSVQNENVTLRQALGLQQKNSWHLVMANVQSFAPQPFLNYFAINKGLTSGVHNGMAVVTSDGILVGVVANAQSDHAQVQYVMDPSFSINASITFASPAVQAASAALALPKGTTVSASAAAGTTTASATAPTAVNCLVTVSQNQLDATMIPQSAPVHSGDLVYTSNINNAVPGGIFIGTVSSVNQQNNDVFQSAAITYAETLSALDQVFVVTSF